MANLLDSNKQVVRDLHFVRQPGDRGTAVMDIFRLESGTLVEH